MKQLKKLVYILIVLSICLSLCVVSEDPYVRRVERHVGELDVSEIFKPGEFYLHKNRKKCRVVWKFINAKLY